MNYVMLFVLDKKIYGGYDGKYFFLFSHQPNDALLNIDSFLYQQECHKWVLSDTFRYRL